jgi:hypothetical protein
MENLYEYDSSIPTFTNETFIATEFFTPKNIEKNVCNILSKKQWKFCTKKFNSASVIRLHVSLKLKPKTLLEYSKNKNKSLIIIIYIFYFKNKK